MFALLAAAMLAGCASAPKFTCTPQRSVTLPKGALLLDVRTQKEYGEKHLDGAILIPHDSVTDHIPGFALDRNAIIYVYCGTGRRAEKALKTLNSIGYRNVINLCGIKAAEKSLAE
jgi:rhodanese-related sulfurtransferase